MTSVAPWVQEIVGPSPVEIGDVVVHPSGRTVKIVEGQWWGEHGLSNHWYWQEVLPDGTLSEIKEAGYICKPAGWQGLRV